MTAARPRLAPVLVRPVDVADVPTVVAIQIEAWRAAYAGIIPAGYLRAMSAAEREGRHLDRLRNPAPGASYLVAERDGRIVGMGACGPARDDDLDPATTGEIYALYADPTAWSTGVGAALMRTCEATLRDAGFSRLTLWVLAGNVRGRTFYERRGMRPDGTEQVLDLGAPVLEVRYAADL